MRKECKSSRGFPPKRVCSDGRSTVSPDAMSHSTAMSQGRSPHAAADRSTGTSNTTASGLRTNTRYLGEFDSRCSIPVSEPAGMTPVMSTVPFSLEVITT